jgi:hypothetical protein
VKKLLTRVVLLFPFIVVPLGSGMLRRIFGAIVVGITTLGVPTLVSANHVPAVVPNQGEPELDTPIKRIPRPIIGALRAPLRELPQIENFQVVGRELIPNPNDSRPRGRNGGIAIQDDCLYVANRLTRRSGTGATRNCRRRSQSSTLLILSTHKLLDIFRQFWAQTTVRYGRFRSVTR